MSRLRLALPFAIGLAVVSLGALADAAQPVVISPGAVPVRQAPRAGAGAGDRIAIPIGSPAWIADGAVQSRQLLRLAPLVTDVARSQIRASRQGDAVVVGLPHGARASSVLGGRQLVLRTRGGERRAAGVAGFADGSRETLRFRVRRGRVLVTTTPRRSTDASTLRISVSRGDATGSAVARRATQPLLGGSFVVERGQRGADGSCQWVNGVEVPPGFRGTISQRELARDDATCERLNEQVAASTPNLPAAPPQTGRVPSTATVTNVSRWEDPVNIHLAEVRTRLQWSFDASAVTGLLSATDAQRHFWPTGWGNWSDHVLHSGAGGSSAFAASSAEFAGAQFFPTCRGRKVQAWFTDNRVTGYPGGRWAVSTATRLTGAPCRRELHFSRDVIVGGR